MVDIDIRDPRVGDTDGLVYNYRNSIFGRKWVFLHRSIPIFALY